MLILVLLSCNSESQENNLASRKMTFNDGWSFQLGENTQASQINFDDSAWKKVKIPHDWSIEEEISKDNSSGAQGGFYPGGVAITGKPFYSGTNGKTSWW